MQLLAPARSLSPNRQIADEGKSDRFSEMAGEPTVVTFETLNSLRGHVASCVYR